MTRHHHEDEVPRRGPGVASRHAIMSDQVREVARAGLGDRPMVSALTSGTSSGPPPRSGVAEYVIRRRALHIGRERSTVDRVLLRHDDDAVAVTGGLQPVAVLGKCWSRQTRSWSIGVWPRRPRSGSLASRCRAAPAAV